MEAEASTLTEEAVQQTHAEAALEGAVVADGGEANSCPPGPKSSDGAIMVLCGEAMADWRTGLWKLGGR